MTAAGAPVILLCMDTPAADTTAGTPAAQDGTTPERAADTLPDRILAMRRAGAPLRDIAAACGCTLGKVQRVIKREIKETVASLGAGVSREEIQRRIFELAPGSLQRIAELRKSRKDDVALRASADLLDRAGFAPVQRSLQLHAVEEMDRAALAGAITGLLARLAAGGSAGPAAAAAPAVPLSLTARPVGTEAPGGATPAQTDQGYQNQTSDEKSNLQMQEEEDLE